MEAGVAMKSRIEFWLSLRCLLYVQVEREAIAYTVLEFSKKKVGIGGKYLGVICVYDNPRIAHSLN